MTCFGTSPCWTWTCGLAALLGLTACQMINPAFDDGADQADEVADATAGESETRGTEESSDSSSSSATTSNDTLDTSGDTLDTSDTLDTNDTLDTSDDTGQEECLVSEPYAPIYGVPIAFGGMCPIDVEAQYLRVTGPGPSPGLVMGQRCGEACNNTCFGDPIPVGVVGLDDFSAPLLLQDGDAQCIKVQTGKNADVIEGLCVYHSLWVGNFAADLLIATRTPELTALGESALQGKPAPAPGQMPVDCSCASFYAAPGEQEELDCCENQMIPPVVSSLFFQEADVMPGGFLPVAINGTNYNFHVAQAQSSSSCLPDPNNELAMSWALVRVPPP